MMDISNIIGSAVVVTQQTSQQINSQQGQAGATGNAVDSNSSVQQQALSGTQNTVNAANQENAANNDDAKGNDGDKDNATTQSLSGVGANLDITA